MEQRGKCREYKDLEEVRQDIEMLNKKAKSSAVSEADKADLCKGGAGTGFEAPGSKRGQAGSHS